MVRQTGAKIILLDRALANYGPETKEAREQLRSTVVAGIEMFPPGEMVKGSGFEGLESFERTNAMETLQTRIRELTPTTDIQRELRSEADKLTGEMLESLVINRAGATRDLEAVPGGASLLAHHAAHRLRPAGRSQCHRDYRANHQRLVRVRRDSPDSRDELSDERYDQSFQRPAAQSS